MFIFYCRPTPKPTANNDTASTSSNHTQSNDTQKLDEPHKSDPSVGMAQQKLAKLKTKIGDTQRKAAEVPDNIRGYALERFLNYVKNYENVLEKKFPGAMKVYRVFMDGVKLFYRDMIDHFKIRKRLVLQETDMTTMTRQELELIYQMPNYIRKMGPLLLVSAIPMAHYVTMPIAYVQLLLLLLCIGTVILRTGVVFDVNDFHWNLFAVTCIQDIC